MADAKTTLEIIIAATDTSAGVFTGVGNRISDLSGAARDVTQPFADLAKGVLAVDAALIALTGGGLAMAVAASGEFGGQFAEITTLFEASSGQIDIFRADILAYSKDSTKSIEDINAAIYEAISSGVKYEDSLKFVRVAEELAVGGKAGLADSVKVLVSSLNAYGAATDKATDYSDALFQAVKIGQTTVPELAHGLAMVTNIAATAGIGFDPLLAAIAALTATGMPTSQAIESIRSMIANIIKPSKEAQEAAAGLGLEFDAQALKSKGLAGFLADLATKTQGNIATTSLLVGDVTGLNAVLTLTGIGAGKFSEALDAMEHKAGSTAAAYKIMVAQFDQINQQLANNTKVVLIAVGNKIKDDYADLVGSLMLIVQSIGAAVESGSFDGLFNVLESAFKKANDTLTAIAKALPEALNDVDFGGLERSLGAAGDSLLGLFDGLDLTKPEDLRIAIQRVIDSLESLVEFSGSMVEAVKPILSAIMTIITAFNDLDDETKGTVGEIVGLLAVVNAVAIPLGVMGLSLSGIGSILSTVSLGMAGTGIAATGFGAAFTAAAAGPAGIALGLTALLAVSYSVGTALYQMTDGAKEFKQISDELAGSQKVLTETTGQVDARLAALSKSTGLNIDSMETLNRLEKEGKILYDAATGSWKAHSEAVELTATELANLTKEALATGPQMKALSAAADVNIESFRDLKTGVVDMAAYYAALGRSDNGPIAATTKALDAVAKQSKETESKMLDLASNERIKAMEFSVQLEIAGIEADTKRVEAAFDSINTAITSTGETMSSLWETLASGGLSFSESWKLQDTLEAEEKRRQDAFDQQKGLTELIIEETKLKMELLRKGGSTLDFKFTGADPLSEYIIIELLKKAQVFVTGEGGAMLLGLT